MWIRKSPSSRGKEVDARAAGNSTRSHADRRADSAGGRTERGRRQRPTAGESVGGQEVTCPREKWWGEKLRGPLDLLKVRRVREHL